ncbi:ER to golgi transport protein/RAD50-interacting protein 1 [Plasmopara halstedii]|uniref:ER to golgi transport protein/RAD50-interacting protein 1 n=1 Tax=Plasmopara halstedii TaxID=4781 RepID=A0A0P1ACC0_PLAHL|nr:ER to golgi transport protein/RAD50-interacting protein 1 [Plasmopara halstedii]CEG38409.1 ER to golgi transport protein/RAD50-interacting protein 1 [Plasmopara halstedii]|eukprot:XP_024574778.1 ER to golgi transport protein/RAD50-interacting protein 1 [Plasmopara halstedii]
MTPSPLSLLSATLLSSVNTTNASEQELNDVEWKNVAKELMALREYTQEEVKDLTKALDQVETLDQTNTSEQTSNISVVLSDIKSIRSQLETAEKHFSQLENVVRPGLSKLQNLHSRATYLEAVVQVEKLSNQAKQQAAHATLDALEAFQSFATYAAAIPDEYSVIRKKANSRLEKLSVDMRQFAIEKLQRTLEKIGWPDPLKTQQELLDKETELCDISQIFEYLLSLQLTQQFQSVVATENLWAMDCLSGPLLLRFRYHFERHLSATNRLSKPEWYLSYVHDQVQAHTRFLAFTLTPALHRHREKLHCWDAKILMLRDLIKAASCKLTKELPTLVAHPPLLCHTLDEVLLFEQQIDNDFGYGSWSSADRHAYPRCIDVFTSSNNVLFAWTSVDVEYAHRVLASSLETESSTEKKEVMWDLEDSDRIEHSQQELIPAIALQFVALIDFLSQRFLLMDSDEHRYLYVMQVHFPLLNRFRQLCDVRIRQLISGLTKTRTIADVQSKWGELFVVVNALQYVAQTLATWEQSSVFLELSRKVAHSGKTREQVLQMHMAYTKQVLARASAAVLATEEATAVRQALVGPGAMIGPTAALTAVYTAGSATMKSLFHRAENNEKIEHQVAATVPSVDSATSTVAARDDNNMIYELNDIDTFIFSHTIFERQIGELKSLALTLLDDGQKALMRAMKHDIENYRSSPFWTMVSLYATNEQQLSIVSSELANCYTLVFNVLSCARNCLLQECWPAFWKALASALDDALFDAFYNRVGMRESTQLSRAGQLQFIFDIQTLIAIFVTDSSKTLPRSNFRRTRDVCLLLQMSEPRVHELVKALDDVTIVPIEQVSSILEACGIVSLTPPQIVRICTILQNVDGHELPTAISA